MRDADVTQKRQKTHKVLVILVVGIVLAVLSVTAFFLSYEKMQNTMALEREEYVSELTAQVVAKVNATITKKLDEVINYANLVNQVSPSSYAKLTEIFSATKADTEDDKILLLSDQGSVYLLNGTTIRVSDPKFLSDIGSKGKVSSTFSPLGTMGDYWLFGSAIEPISVEGVKMVAIIRANKNTTYSEEMTVSMFKQNTYSFLIDDSSDILIKPGNTTGYGSNLMNSLLYSGLSQSEAQLISQHIQNHEKQSVFFMLNDEQWLLQTAFARDKYSVALLLPLKLTSSDTIKAMNQTMLLVVIFLLLSMASVISVIIIAMKSRTTKRIQEEQFHTELLMQTAQNKTDFLSKMSHDIRTPLNGIIGMAFLAADNLDDRPALEDNLAKIQSSADYLLSLVNDILDMSKIDSGKLQLHYEPANAEDFLGNIASRFEVQVSKQKIDLSLYGTAPLPDSYRMDKLRVNQILMNLISNAVKFTPYGGKIDFTLKVIPIDETKDNIVYTVADTGTGMTDAFMSRIFMAFEQESTNTAQLNGGSGLGLSIVKRLTDLMGGRVSVESKIGCGSTFTVSLPMEKTSKCKEEKLRRADPAIAEQSAEQLLGKRVLLAEDHPINAQIATKLLEKWGLQVTVAENGQLAVDQFNAAEEGYYAIIFMDIKMPVMDGYEATRQIRASSHPDAKKIPIYAMSANAFDDDVRESLAVGMDGHLRKPIEIPALKQVIEEKLAQKESTE